MARIATAGPLRLGEIRDCPALARATSTQLCNAVSALVRIGLVRADQQADIAVLGDGTRCRVDYTLYCLARSGGGEP